MYKDKRVIHIVAVGLNGEIGAKNELLWDIPEDLKFFKETTLGHVCLAGRKTVESFPSPLKRRVVIEVTSRWNKMCGGSLTNKVILLENMNIAVNHSNTLNTDCIYIIGGASIYKATEDIVDTLLITQVDCSYEHADTFYHMPEGFEMVDKSEWKENYNGVCYRFTVWERLPF